jgi:hypothetical protein
VKSDRPRLAVKVVSLRGLGDADLEGLSQEVG